MIHPLDQGYTGYLCVWEHFKAGIVTDYMFIDVRAIRH